MNKTDIAKRLAHRLELKSATTRDAVDGVFEVIGEALANGDEVRIVGFGTFATRDRPARTGRNPRTGEVVEIEASTTPAFKPGKALKDAVNGRSAS